MLVGSALDLGEARSLSTCPLEREGTQALTLRPEPPLKTTEGRTYTGC